MSTIGDKIRTLRTEAMLTQGELAKRAGIHRVTLAKYEGGMIEPKPKILSQLALALHVSIDDLLDMGITSNDECEFRELLDIVRREPERRILFSLVKDADISEVRRVIAIIDALKKPYSEE